MDLTKYSPEEESEILHAKQLEDLRAFGIEANRIFSQAKDRQAAMAQVEHLKSLFFIGYKEQKKKDIEVEAKRMVGMMQKTYRVRWGPRGAEMEIGE